MVLKSITLQTKKGLALGVLTTTASKNEIANLEEVLETVNVDLPIDIPLKTDKGYQSKKNGELLKKKKPEEPYSEKGKKEYTIDLLGVEV